MLDDTFFMIFGLGTVPILLMAATIDFRSIFRPSKIVWAGPRRGEPLIMPSAAETARSVRRFQEAAARAELMDFVWEDYSKGRALLLDDIRRAAERKGRRTKKSGPPPKWI